MKKLALFSFIILFSCSGNQKTPQQDQAVKTAQKILNMHYDNYNDYWKQIVAFDREGLPKSAYKLTKEIYAKAKSEENTPQLIKVLMYQSRYLQTLEEDAQLKIINNFKKEITESKAPTKNILENIMANLYWQYYQQNRYKFAQRSKTASKVDKNDFRTWDLKILFNEVSIHYNHSLQNALLLQKIPIDKYETIIIHGVNSRQYQPTLYDFLVKDAINFYQTNENAITSPAYKFEIDNPKLLGDLDTFIAEKISSKDTNSLQLKALRLYQEWLRFRKNDNDINALAFTDLKRLDFVHNNAVFNDKDALFTQALQQFVKKHEQSDIAAMAYAKLAQQLLNKSNNYKEGDSEKLKWANKKALDICNQTIRKYPKGKGVTTCRHIKRQILQKNISVELQTNAPENQKALAKISFKNVNEIALAVYKIDYNDLKHLHNYRYNREETLAFIKKQTKINSWHQSLINDNQNDYRQHSTETVMSPLPNGQYLLVGEANTGEYGFKYFQVTDIALEILKIENRLNATVINRNNGNIIPNAKIDITRQKNGEYHNYAHKKSDKKGTFSHKLKRDYYNHYLYKVSYQDKIAYFTNNESGYYYNDNDHRKDNLNIFTFTDRSIYRPGQTVYFKSILLKQMRNSSEVVAHQKLDVSLKDVNGQELETLHIKTNEFGAIQGNFVLPTQTLTGNFSIVITGDKIRDYHQFKVEEYKRPKFEAEFKKVEKSYKVNETVSVTGTAKSYAGSSISNANVTYRVKRQVQMPRWWYWYRPYGYTVEAQEIAHGTVKTNDQGEFEINFSALPDNKVNKKDHPVFRYEITADVTDINGETHSATTVVSVGYHSLLADIRVNDKIDKSKSDTIVISTTNLNGVAQNAQGKVAIYKLQAPSRILTNRPWSAPDMQNISKEQFIQYFPHTPYDKQETDYHFWTQKQKYFEQSFDTEKSDKVALKNMQDWASGKYIAILKTQDKDGNEIVDKVFFDIYSPTENIVADNKLIDVFVDKESYQPNNQVKLKMGSSAHNIYLRVLIEKAQKIISDKRYLLKNTYETITVPVTQNNLGGFAIHYSLNAFNDVTNGNISVKVPYPSKQLEIETITFRDKLLPGQKETWQFKLKGPKGDKVAAEMLAAMYDASLDAFTPHQWYFNPINYHFYRPHFSIKHADSYGTSSLNIHYVTPPYESYAYQEDKLNWFGFRFYTRRYDNVVIRGARSIKSSRKLSGQVAGVQITADSESYADASIVPEAITADGIDRKDKDLNFDANNNIDGNSQDKPKEKLQVAARKNLQETAFFYPQLHTDKNGNISFSFTTPEALTKWNVQLLAYDKQLNHGYKKLTVQTQKDLMLFPNAPRFVREGDQLVFSTKIANMTDKAGAGVAELEISDAFTNKDLTANIVKQANQQDFSIDAKGNTQVSWTLDIPDNAQALTYKVMAQMGNHSDGEQNAWPVLSNRMLVTETMPMWVRGNQTKTFTLDKLQNNTSNTLKNHQLTLEITSNPAWYAVQALPYLMEYPYECSEQTFSRYYANALASHIANSNPKIRMVFDAWKNVDTQALLSNLEKNQELKSMIIEETPWLRDAKSESEQKKRIGLLFDMNQMSHQLDYTLQKLKKMQLHDGGFTWFEGGRYSNRYITQHIVSGFGHLQHLKVSVKGANSMLVRAVRYIDNKMLDDYNNVLDHAKESKNEKKYLEEYRP